MVDEDKLHEFLGRLLGDLGGAFIVPLVRIGETFGLYKALDAGGPVAFATDRPGRDLDGLVGGRGSDPDDGHRQE